MYSFLNLYFAPHARDGTRLDGARTISEFGVPCSNLRSFGSKYTVLKTVLVTLGLFGDRGIVPPLPPFIAPLPMHS